MGAGDLAAVGGLRAVERSENGCKSAGGGLFACVSAHQGLIADRQKCYPEIPTTFFDIISPSRKRGIRRIQ